MLAQKYLEGQKCKKKSFENSENRWPLDDHDDCTLVVQTYKKLHIVIYG